MANVGESNKKGHHPLLPLPLRSHFIIVVSCIIFSSPPFSSATLVLTLVVVNSSPSPIISISSTSSTLSTLSLLSSSHSGPDPISPLPTMGEWTSLLTHVSYRLTWDAKKKHKEMLFPMVLTAPVKHPQREQNKTRCRLRGFGLSWRSKFFFVPSKSSMGQSVITLLQWIICSRLLANP